MFLVKDHLIFILFYFVLSDDPQAGKARLHKLVYPEDLL